MAIDAATQFSKEWWLNTLAKQLQDRRVGRCNGQAWSVSSIKAQRFRPSLELLDDHFRGDPPLPVAAEGWKDHFREVCRLGRLNVAELVVVAKANRMSLRDFRTAAVDDALGDEKARDIMRFNAMKVISRDVHESQLSLGDGYVIVSPKKDNEKWCRVTAEDPMQVITAHDSATNETLAGLKMFRDEWDASDLAYVYLKGRVEVFRNSGSTSMTTRGYRATNGWEHDTKLSGTSFEDRVAVVRFRNRQGVGEYEHHLSTLDRINDLVLNMLVISKVQAFRQRALVGAPDFDEDGEEIDYTGDFVAAPGALWKLPDGASFWESQPTDLSPIRLAIRDDLEHIAAITSTPLHSITPDAANGSAEGAALMREEHAYAVEDRRDRAAQGWAEVMSLCFLGMGDKDRADVTQIEPIWGPVERFSLVDKASSAAQLKGILPAEAIFTDVLQYPPAEVPNLQKMRAADTIFLSAVLPTPAFSGAPTPLGPATGVGPNALLSKQPVLGPDGKPLPGGADKPAQHHLVPGPNPLDPRQR